MIDLEFVQRLITMVEASGVHEMEIEREGTRVRIAKPPIVAHQVSVPVATAVHGPSPELPKEPDGSAGRDDDSSLDLVDVTAPMVGTFYRAPAPNAPPYVEKGAHVAEGDTLCIIEAMKLMNELEAEVAGRVAEICIENGNPVEYGQTLFRIDPD